MEVLTKARWLLRNRQLQMLTVIHLWIVPWRMCLGAACTIEIDLSIWSITSPSSFQKFVSDVFPMCIFHHDRPSMSCESAFRRQVLLSLTMRCSADQWWWTNRRLFVLESLVLRGIDCETGTGCEMGERSVTYGVKEISREIGKNGEESPDFFSWTEEQSAITHFRPENFLY